MRRALGVVALCLLSGGASATCIDLEASGSLEGVRKVQLPEVAYLGLVAEEGQNGSFAITAYPLLPDGGIRSEHLCGTVMEVPFSGGRRLGEGIVQRVSLQFRQDVDYARAYPAFHDAIWASGQLRVAPSGVYAVHRFPEGAGPVAEDPAFARLLAAAGTCADVAIIAGRAALVPDC